MSEIKKQVDKLVLKEISELLDECNKMKDWLRDMIAKIGLPPLKNIIYKEFINHCKLKDEFLLLLFDHIYNINVFLCLCNPKLHNKKMVKLINSKEVFFINILVYNCSIIIQAHNFIKQQVFEALKSKYLRDLLKEMINIKQFYSNKKNYNKLFKITLNYDNELETMCHNIKL